jgi:large subunit ribosomal protein L21
MLSRCGRCVAAFQPLAIDRRPSVFAVISLGGKQYRVRKGEYLTVDRLAHEPGSTFSPTVLLATEGDDVLIDAAELAKVTVTARVDEHLLGTKIRIFQYKPKKSTKKARGHRSRLSRITIEDIAVGSAPRKAAAKAAPEKAPAAKAAPERATARKAAPEKAPAAKAAPERATARKTAPEKAPAAEAAPKKAPAKPRKKAEPAAEKPAADKPAAEQEA